MGMPKEHRVRLPRIIWAAAWVSFFADFSTEMIYGILPAFYLHTLSLSILSLGVIEGIAESIVALTKLFSGTISDRTGHRNLWMLAGYGLSGLAKPLIGLATTGLGFGLLRAVDRFGKGIRGAPRDALVSAAVEENERGRAFGLQRALDHAGALAGGLTAAGLLAAGLLAPRNLFFLAAVPGAIAVLIIALFIREPRVLRENLPEQAPRTRAFSISAAWRGATPSLRRYLLPASVFAVANASDILLLAISYDRFIASGISDQGALARLPLLWALLHVVKSAGSSWGGTLSDRLGPVPLIRLGWAVYAGVYVIAGVLAAGGPVLLAWPMFAAYGLYTILSEAPERALIARLAASPEQRGAAFGLVHFITGILALPATVLAGLLWLRVSPVWAFGVDAALAALAALLLTVYAPEPVQTQDPT
jgi:MFS transporter